MFPFPVTASGYIALSIVGFLNGGKAEVMFGHMLIYGEIHNENMNKWDNAPSKSMSGCYLAFAQSKYVRPTTVVSECVVYLKCPVFSRVQSEQYFLRGGQEAECKERGLWQQLVRARLPADRGHQEL